MLRALYIFAALLFTFKAEAQRDIDVLHYKFNIELNDKNDTVYGVSIIKFVSTQKNQVAELDLQNIDATGKGMKVTSVLYSPFSSKWLPFTHKENKLILDLKNLSARSDTVPVTIFYKGIPADGLIISKNKYGNRTFFSDNWPNRAHNWIPCVDDPADKATVEFIVTAPSHYQVISNGIQIEETNLPDNKKLTHWKEDVPLPTKVMVIGAAELAVNNAGEVNCIPVSSWVYPENKKEGFYDYAQAKEILAWYINYIGPYAYKKLANVQSKTMFGGMENASAIFYYENSVTGKRQEEALLAHEIVHQWFGNSATEKSFAHIWLSEGFATYLTHVYIEAKYGIDSLNKRMQKERDEVIEFVNTSKRPVVDSTTDYMSLLNVNSYQKGGWVLHMLRRQLGDSVFRKAVRKYYETYAGKNADTKDLQKIFETVSGKNLEQFFKQWLYTPANPKLNIKWKYDTKQKKILVTVTQLQSEIFYFPLEIRLGSKRVVNPQSLKLTVSKRNETFSFPVTDIITAINADPYTSLLAEILVGEMK